MRTRRQAGSLEALTLDVLWAADGPLAPVSVHAQLNASGLELAYTTVTTTLTRLNAKGLVSREAAGRGFLYAPTTQAADDAARRMHELLAAGPGREAVLSRFVATLSSEDETALLELLRRSGGEGAS